MTTSETSPSPPVITKVKPPPPPNNLLGSLLIFDRNISLRLHTISETLIPRFILRALESIGLGDCGILIPFLIFSLNDFRELRRSVIAPLLFGMLLDFIFIRAVKQIVRRPRPVYKEGMHLDHGSFPSDISSRVFFVAVFCWLVWDEIVSVVLTRARSGDLGIFGVAEAEMFQRWGLSVVWGWAVFASVSRILFGRHFVSDVVAGACVGVAEALAIYHFLRFKIHKHSLSFSM